MAIDKNVTISQVVIDEEGRVFVCERTRYVEDGRLITESLERKTFEPGADVSGLPERVAAVANLVWTPDVVARYRQAEEARATRNARPRQG